MRAAPKPLTGLPRWFVAIGDSTLDRSEKAVGYALLRYADWTTGEKCYPSVSTIVRLSGLTARTVQATIKRLAAIGVVTVLHRSKGGTRRGRGITNQLRLNLTVIEAMNPANGNGLNPAGGAGCYPAESHQPTPQNQQDYPANGMGEQTNEQIQVNKPPPPPRGAGGGGGGSRSGSEGGREAGTESAADRRRRLKAMDEFPEPPRRIPTVGDDGEIRVVDVGGGSTAAEDGTGGVGGAAGGDDGPEASYAVLTDYGVSAGKALALSAHHTAAEVEAGIEWVRREGRTAESKAGLLVRRLEDGTAAEELRRANARRAEREREEAERAARETTEMEERQRRERFGRRRAMLYTLTEWAERTGGAAEAQLVLAAVAKRPDFEWTDVVTDAEVEYLATGDDDAGQWRRIFTALWRAAEAVPVPDGAVSPVPTGTAAVAG